MIDSSHFGVERSVIEDKTVYIGWILLSLIVRNWYWQYIFLMPRTVSRDRSVIVELSHDDIDPALRKLQEEWEELLMHDELTVDIPPKIEFESEQDKHQLMALW